MTDPLRPLHQRGSAAKLTPEVPAPPETWPVIEREPERIPVIPPDLSTAKPWVLEQHGRVWSVMHRATELRISVMRPYPGPEDLPPIEVANFATRKEAEAAAAEIDWQHVEQVAALPETQAYAARWREKKRFDAAYQTALQRAREGLEPWPWEPGGLLHRSEPGLADQQLDLGLAA